ncbi:hypothetical protein N7475_000015 [Penicillium sp. IBT 31633x]|nr:hypothetical protein N7475_000015 [Penicillium sp. IBT 31633x]
MPLPLKKEMDNFYIFLKVKLIYGSLIIFSLTNFDIEEVIYLIRVRNMIMAHTTSRTFIKYYRPYRHTSL